MNKRSFIIRYCHLKLHHEDGMWYNGCTDMNVTIFNIFDNTLFTKRSFFLCDVSDAVQCGIVEELGRLVTQTGRE